MAQWVPTCLVFGLFDKLVKLDGHDQPHRGAGNGTRLTPEEEAKSQEQSSTFATTRAVISVASSLNVND